MFNLGRLTTDLLNTLDSAAKDTLEEPQVSATSLRKAKKRSQGDQLQEDSSGVIAEGGAGEDDDLVDGEDGENYNDDETELEEEQPTGISGLIGKGLSTASNLLPGGGVGLLSRSGGSGIEIASHSTASASASASDSELRALLKKKNAEIEALNAECLELEESCTSLKKEVEEAWDSYKSSQEKAMARESELQEEIRLIQKAKTTDKQQLQVQLTRMNDDTAELLKRIKALESERDEAVEKFTEMSELSQQWETKESEFLNQIEELKAGTVQGAHNLREELQREKDVNQALRTEHQTILRQNEQTLRELESQNMASIQALSDKEKELSSLKTLLNQAGGPKEYQSALRDLEAIRHDYDALMKTHEASTEKVSQYERRIKQVEAEHKALAIKYEDDRSHSHELLTLADKRVVELQDKLKAWETGAITLSNTDTLSGNNNLSVASSDTATGPNSVHNKTTQLMEQIQSLSKQLLKKQEQVMELQTEKSVLKSRTVDILSRCTQAEQELTRLKNLEDGRDDDEDGDEEDRSYHSSSQYPSALGDYRVGLTHRGGPALGGFVTPADQSPMKMSQYGSSASKYKRVKGSGKIISELESLGVRPSASVASAVNFVDSLTLISGRILRNNSLLRVLFVLYLLFLHIWVIFVLGLHIHSIDADVTPKVNSKIT